MISIDETLRQVTVTDQHGTHTYALDTREAFEAISRVWLRSSWEAKYSYTFSWLGRPIIQLPEDLLRIQEALYTVKPDVVVETGIAYGGSLIFYASLFEAMHRGRVIGVDIEIRPSNREAIEAHDLFRRIELVIGSSTDEAIVDSVRAKIQPNESVFVVLDSNHSYDHVAAELEAYAPLVTAGSYIVSTDGIMQDLVGSPRAQADWAINNPARAARDFAARHPEFALEEPAWQFNESVLRRNVTYWPNAWLRRLP